MTIKIMLAEDHAILRAGLQSLIERQAGMEIVGQAENGRQAVDLAVELKPDVIIMDVTMPDINGIEATRLIRAANPDIKVIALSAFDTPDFVMGMVGAGASGYLLKDNLFEDLLKAIEAVMQGQSFLCTEVATIVVRACQEDQTSLSKLEADEIELIRLLAQGHSARDIGAVQDLSIKTVEGRRRRLLKKLHLDSIAELVQYAIAKGLIPKRSAT
jgi:two-component system, NarL family, response regulator NreC